MIITVMLVVTSSISAIIISFLCWGHLSSVFSNFQVYNILFQTAVKTLCFRVPRTYSLSECQFIYPLTNISPIPLPQSPQQALFCSLSLGLANLDFTYKWYHTIFVFLFLIYLTYNILKGHPCCCTWQNSFFLMVE